MTEPIEVVAEVIETPSKELEATCDKGIIKDNIDTLESYIDEILKPYIGAKIDVSNAQQVKECRDAMSALNKIKKPIDAEKNRIKSEYVKPLNAFENRVKAVTGKIDSAREALKAQLDEATKNHKEKRRSLLKLEFEGCSGPLAGILSFDSILDTTWLNPSTQETKAIKGMQDSVIGAISQYETLVASGLLHKDECVKLFCETLDLTAALKLDAQLTEKERQEEEFKARRAEVAASVEVRREPVGLPVEVTAEPIFEWAITGTFRGTRRELEALKGSLKSLRIVDGNISNKGVIQ